MLVKHLVSRLRLLGVVLAAAALAACGGGGGGGGGGSGSGGGGTDTSTPTTSITLPYSATLSGSSGSKRNFVFTLPAGLSVVSIKLSGGSGALNMSATDSTGATKCPTVTHSGKEVTCNVNNPASGQWTVAITGGTTFSGVSMSVSSSTASVSLPHSVTGLSGAENSNTYYTFIVPAGTASVRANLTYAGGATGDADLYLISPTGSTGSLCMSEATGTTAESCTYNNPGSGIWMVQVHGFEDFTGVNVSISTNGATLAGFPTYTSTVDSETVNSTFADVTGILDSSQDATITVGAGVASMSAVISGGTGNADIWIIDPNDKLVCVTRATGNTDSCSILQPQAGSWKVRLYGTSAYSGVTLKVYSK
ncbi:PPC domain-containing protein [Hylemonella sp. W303a]|uniref:PPC domain-containing protein n=1 Tax=Hylemonella sp. W303a TaxID=3389873 RepID=UPI00396AFACA